jgi:hypothetical protein
LAQRLAAEDQQPRRCCCCCTCLQLLLWLLAGHKVLRWDQNCWCGLLQVAAQEPRLTWWHHQQQQQLWLLHLGMRCC